MDHKTPGTMENLRFQQKSKNHSLVTLLFITTIEKYFKSRNYCDVDTALSVDPICCELRTES